jgi:hypothetical protein
MGYNSDGAREFPWQRTAGLDISPNGSSEKFIIPPASGPLAKAFWRDRSNSPEHFGGASNENGPQLGWEFTSGTTFGEVLKIKDPDTGEQIPFEVRLRTKTAEGKWQMDVLRPFSNPSELAAGIRRICSASDRPAGCSQLGASLDAIERPQVTAVPRTNYVNRSNFGTARDPFTLNRTSLTAIAKTALLHDLPALPNDVVRKLLKTSPFQSVFNKPWIPADGTGPAGWAPTTRSDFNIVPKSYFAAFIPMTQESCTKCHDSAGRHVDNFEPAPDQMFAPSPDDRQRPRTWYNFIPGDDTNLSWHPFSADSVRQGAIIGPRAFEQCLVQNRLIEGR